MEASLSLTHKTLLSQCQRQSLEILAMDAVKLNEFLHNEYLENPLFDYTGARVPSADNAHRFYEPAPVYGRTHEEIMAADERRSYDIPAQDSRRIKDYLLYQLSPADYSGQEWALMEYMVDCLEDSGFFTLSAEEVAEKTHCPAATVSRLLDILRHLEPDGIFAPDLKHCLLRQLELQEMEGTLAWEIVSSHLEDLGAGRISSISRSLKASTLEVRKSIGQITQLNPRPMKYFSTGSASYLIPDILIKEENGEWEVALNDNWMENCGINDYYLKMMRESSDPELSAYFQRRLERARFVMSGIRQRRKTLLAIGGAVLEKQKGFLSAKGCLKPMTMAGLAAQLHIHPSTVSRAVKGKYLQYPAGTIPLRDLFSDSDMDVMQIREEIKRIIAAEDKKKPYSDQALSELLKQKNIQISRRTVAKYREEAGIKGSFLRRQE